MRRRPSKGESLQANDITSAMHTQQKISRETAILLQCLQPSARNPSYSEKHISGIRPPISICFLALVAWLVRRKSSHRLAGRTTTGSPSKKWFVLPIFRYSCLLRLQPIAIYFPSASITNTSLQNSWPPVQLFWSPSGSMGCNLLLGAFGCT